MMEIAEPEVRGIMRHFETLPDPRCHVNRGHLLIDLIVISICGVLAGADGPAAIVEWANSQASWLRKFLALPSGIPSHDTVGRVLNALQPAAFQKCFGEWLKSLGEAADSKSEPREGDEPRDYLAIDGKTLRRSHDRKRGLGPLHLVSVFATEHGLVLGQMATAEKSNEITAIPELLEQVDVKDAVVTIDAAGCQKKIAGKIIDRGGDFLLSLKGNQSKMHTAVRLKLLPVYESGESGPDISRFVEEEKSHGRTERREYIQINAPRDLPNRAAWKGLRTIGLAVRSWNGAKGPRCELRFFLSSLSRNVRQFAKAGRRHWRIETTLHWCLDVTFREDESRVRGRKIAENLAWLRRLALTLIKQHPEKNSVAMKRRKAGWNTEYLLQVLTGTGT